MVKGACLLEALGNLCLHELPFLEALGPRATAASSRNSLPAANVAAVVQSSCPYSVSGADGSQCYSGAVRRAFAALRRRKMLPRSTDMNSRIHFRRSMKCPSYKSGVRTVCPALTKCAMLDKREAPVCDGRAMFCFAGASV